MDTGVKLLLKSKRGLWLWEWWQYGTGAAVFCTKERCISQGLYPTLSLCLAAMIISKTFFTFSTHFHLCQTHSIYQINYFLLLSLPYSLKPGDTYRDALVQERRSSIANTLELCHSCTNLQISAVNKIIFGAGNNPFLFRAKLLINSTNDGYMQI